MVIIRALMMARVIGRVMVTRQPVPGRLSISTMPETAEIISRAMDKKVVFERVPIEEMRKMSEDLAVMYEWFDRVGYNVDIGAVEKNYGVKFRTFSEWASKVNWR